MADPNTQIDWWIAQAWQEAQGGADNESLVAWLYDNGLTAVSSYTILQAALSCSPDEAKQMVFGHPVWAGAEQEVDLSDVGYTSDTLEPEPEPDATFGLDDWADEIEEDAPVYGEPGYEPPPNAAPPLPTKEGEAGAPRNMLLDAYSEMADESAGGDGLAATEDQSLAGAGEFDGATEEPEAFASPMVEDEPEPEPEPIAAFDSDEDDSDEPEIDADQIFETEPGWEDHAAPAQVSEAVGSLVPPAGDAARADMAAREPEPEPDVEDEFAFAPAGPPILRMPPTTPAQRAATFAAAFGKKSASGGGGSPQSETGPVAQAETAPALNKTEPPQPATAPVQMPPPLVLDPLPEIPEPPPAPAAEPLFTASARREPRETPPLFPPAAQEPAQGEPETRAPDEPLSASPDEIAHLDQDAAADGREADPEEAVPPVMADQETGAEQEASRESATDSDDLEAVSDDPGSAAGDFGELLTADLAEEVSEPGEEEPAGDREDDFAGLHDADVPANPEDDDDDEFQEQGDRPADSDAENAAQARKRLLLDPDGEDDPDDEDPESLAEAARKLGISFRGPDPMEAGIDPEVAKAAKELGISFRGDSGGSATAEDEVALEAQKLGISFREGDISSAPQKPLIVKYLPMILGIIAIFFLLLLGATFAGPFIAWLKG